MQQNWYFD